MKRLQFKTNINCNNCIRSVTPFLNSVDSIDLWKVDTDNPAKILTVELEEEGTEEEVINAVREAGFEIEKG